MSSIETNLLQRVGEHGRIALGIGGLIAVVIGLLMLFFPLASGAAAMLVIAALMAAYALVVGVVYIGTSLFSRTVSGWARTGPILLGVLYIIAGIIIIANFRAVAAVLAIFLSVIIGLLWIFEGVMAFSMMKQASNKTWSIIYGIVSIIAGLVLIFSPIMGAITLWLLLGISLVVLGLVQAVRAFTTKIETVEVDEVVEEEAR
ncbi:MAG: HdeD family acid-resistance protein [Leucobacter sp.]